MKTRVSPHPSLIAAFTLVELLTVIAIIAILMGLLFPAISAVKENARRVQAKNDATQILTAVKAYNTEYGRYPSVEDPSKKKEKGAQEDSAVGDKDANMAMRNNTLFNTLRALPEGLNDKHKLNPRRVVFFEGKGVSNPAQPRAGFVERGAEDIKGCFYDPWGKEYNVILDADYDNTIKVREYYTDVPDDESPKTGVVVFSLGKDNKLGTKNDKKLKDADDIVSWK
ncbi:type II secretion system protein [Verrucomicrobiota bacterium sgz303538]